MGSTNKIIILLLVLSIPLIVNASSIYDDKSKVLVVEMNKDRKICYEDGTNCPLISGVNGSQGFATTTAIGNFTMWARSETATPTVYKKGTWCRIIEN